MNLKELVACHQQELIAKLQALWAKTEVMEEVRVAWLNGHWRANAEVDKHTDECESIVFDLNVLDVSSRGSYDDQVHETALVIELREAEARRKASIVAAADIWTAYVKVVDAKALLNERLAEITALINKG